VKTWIEPVVILLQKKTVQDKNKTEEGTLKVFQFYLKPSSGQLIKNNS